MKTNHPCNTCGVAIHHVCLGHIFPASEAGVALSDAKHNGEKKQGCACNKERKNKKKW